MLSDKRLKNIEKWLSSLENKVNHALYSNKDNDQWLKKMHPFSAKMINNSLTVDLNSWHAFVELQKAFDQAPKIYPAHTYRHSTLPVIKF